MADLLLWEDIADQFTDTLLLGNGASIALDNCFSYRSLLDHAQRQAWITADVQAVFQHFGSTDFELVMRMLWHTFHVNRALGMPEKRTQQAYLDIRQALIHTVRETHIDFQSISHHLDAAQRFMGRYSRVLSLNYDLIVYWAMLEGNTTRGGRWFKDCWVSGDFDGDWGRFADPIDTSDTTLVFYPHGNLVFATHPTGGETKLAVNAAAGSLLERIIAAWEDEDYLPLFVSEGESAQKEASIARNGYLTSVYNDVLVDIGPSVAVYGWGMAENDEHILRRLCGRRVGRMAVSIYRGGRSDADIDLECRRIERKVHQHNPRLRLSFFDSSSTGCWINT